MNEEAQRTVPVRHLALAAAIMGIVALGARRELRKNPVTVTADVILLVVGNGKTERLARQNGRSYAHYPLDGGKYRREWALKSQGIGLVPSTFRHGGGAIRDSPCKTWLSMNGFLFVPCIASIRSFLPRGRNLHSIACRHSIRASGRFIVVGFRVSTVNNWAESLAQGWNRVLNYPQSLPLRRRLRRTRRWSLLSPMTRLPRLQTKWSRRKRRRRWRFPRARRRPIPLRSR